MTPGADPVHKVTIIPRGMALGLTMQLPEADKHTYTKEYLEGMLAVLMGGRSAEEIFLGHITTGAGNDIERATDIARNMVCEWGMSDLGPLAFGKKEEAIFLGREIAQHRDFSEDTALQIDQRSEADRQRGYEKAKNLLSTHKETLDNIAQALLVREVLDANEVRLLMEGKPLPEKPRTPPTAPPTATAPAADPKVVRPEIAAGTGVHAWGFAGEGVEEGDSFQSTVDSFFGTPPSGGVFVLRWSAMRRGGCVALLALACKDCGDPALARWAILFRAFGAWLDGLARPAAGRLKELGGRSEVRPLQFGRCASGGVVLA